MQRAQLRQPLKQQRAPRATALRQNYVHSAAHNLVMWPPGANAEHVELVADNMGACDQRWLASGPAIATPHSKSLLFR